LALASLSTFLASTWAVPYAMCRGVS